MKKIGLIGVRKTMEGSFYPEVFARYGIAIVSPTEDERAYVHDKIYQELVHNRFSEATRQGYLSIIQHLSWRGAEGVVLACTEIPLLLKPDQIPVPSISTTELHCRAAVERANAE